MVLLLTSLFACSGSSGDKGGDDSGGGGGDDTGKIDDRTPEQIWCDDNGFGLSQAWDAKGPYGTDRWSIAEDFTVPLQDGKTWTLSENWKGCETFVFVPDMERSSNNDVPITSPSDNHPGDLADLLAASPRNAHWFFVADDNNSDDADAANAATSEWLTSTLGDLSKEDAAWWTDHTHVVSGQARDLDGWLADVLHNGIGEYGFAVDRAQKLRGVGSLSDIKRQDNSIPNWPFENNLAYAAYDAQHLELEAQTEAALDPSDLVLPAWQGEVISQYADMPIDFPSAEDLQQYDRLLIDVDMRCPDHGSVEFNNCGAWDYIANVFLDDGTGKFPIEVSRMITSYHRETHWIVDASQMLPLLKGGKQNVRWSWAPEWNVQPTETWFSFRLGKTGAKERPTVASYLFSGGAFNSKYNVGRKPIDVPIPADAKKVELYAIITGHGGATHNCAEFCNTQHEFTVNDAVYMKEDPQASTSTGCATAMVAEQGTPNQWGTWWYGRGGWCPGQPVVPFVVDVTKDVKPGSTATVSYRGLYNDHTPDDDSGDIVMSSWIVVYE